MRDHSSINKLNRQSQSTISINNLNRQSTIKKSAVFSHQSSMDSVVVHYQEIALKGNNRPWFVARLARNLREATADLDVRQVRVLMGRIELVLGDEAAWLPVRERLARVFGVANFAQAGRAPLDVDAIAAAILTDLTGRPNPRTFRVSARRTDKRFPLTSPQIEREVGGRIKEARGWTVDLDDPEFTIHV